MKHDFGRPSFIMYCFMFLVLSGMLINVASFSAAEGTDFYPGQLWAEPNIGHLRQVMRLLVMTSHSLEISNQSDTERIREKVEAVDLVQRAQRARSEVLFEFSRDSVALIIKKRLREVQLLLNKPQR